MLPSSGCVLVEVECIDRAGCKRADEKRGQIDLRLLLMGKKDHLLGYM